MHVANDKLNTQFVFSSQQEKNTNFLKQILEKITRCLPVDIATIPLCTSETNPNCCARVARILFIASSRGMQSFNDFFRNTTLSNRKFQVTNCFHPPSVLV